MPVEQRKLFEQLAASRSNEHTGGRKKKEELHGNSLHTFIMLNLIQHLSNRHIHKTAEA